MPIKLAQPVAMQVTNEQKKYLAGELEKLGYVEDTVTWDRSHIVTRRRDGGSYTDLNHQSGWDKDTFELVGYDPELFLALAAMTEGPLCGKGEWATITEENDECPQGHMEVIEKEGTNLFTDFWRKATKEEIIAHFAKNGTMNKTNRKIIGYKAPYQLFSHSINPVKKGDILYPCIHSKAGAFYADLDASKTTSYSRHIPGEIVEQWEAVYEPQEQIFKVGNFEIAVRSGKAWHKSDNISNFVRELCEYFCVSMKFDKFLATVGDVTFSATGCQISNSKLSEWLEVYNALK